MDVEKFTRIASAVRIGGKGSVRRKKKAVYKTDDKSTMKRIGVHTIPVTKDVKGHRIPSVGLVPRRKSEDIVSDDDGEDIAAVDYKEEWGMWGHNHDLCIESLWGAMPFSSFTWEDISSDFEVAVDHPVPTELVDEPIESLLECFHDSKDSDASDDYDDSDDSDDF